MTNKNIGETWHIQFRPGTILKKAKILDVTEKTILIKINDKNYSRYALGDITFIERIKK